MAAMGATTVIDAEAQRDEAAKQDGIAYDNHKGSPNSAGLQYMAARDAADDAEDAAENHILGLFIVANAGHITEMDVDDPLTEENESATVANEAQDKARVANRGAVNTAIAAVATDADGATSPNSASEVEAIPTWPADRGSGDDLVRGSLSIALSIGNTEIATFDAVDDASGGQRHGTLEGNESARITPTSVPSR